MYYLKFIYYYIPLYLVVLNIYEQSDFFRSELKSIEIISKLPEKKFTCNFFILIFGIYGPIIYLQQSFPRSYCSVKILVH